MIFLRFFISISFVVLMLFTSIVQADTQSIDNDIKKSDYYLEPIKVQANPVRDREIGDFSLTKSELTVADINRSTASDIVELLQNVNGVNTVTESIFSGRTVGQGRIKVRGNNPKMLIDGRPISAEVFNCIVGNVLSLNNVESVEVIRGSESVLYGTDGLGGVINVITQKPTKYGSTAKFHYGGYNSAFLYFNTQNKISNFFYSVGYEFKNTDGHTDTSALRSNDFFIKTGYDINPNISTEISGKYYAGNYDDSIDEVKWDKDRYGINFNIKGIYQKSSFLVQYHLTHGEHYSYLLSNNNENFHSTDFMNGIRSYYRLRIKNHDLLSGFDYKNYGGEIFNQMWTNSGEKSAFELAPYLVYKLLLNTGTKFIGGIRYNYNNMYKSIVLPKIGISQKIKDLTFTISGNKAYRTPSTLQTQIHKFLNNNELVPEEAWNYEFKTNYHKPVIGNITLTLFTINGTNRIVSSQGSFKNIGEYRHWGIEIDYKKHILPNLMLNFGYNYLNTGDDSELQYENKVSGSIAYLNKALTINLGTEYVTGIYGSANKIDPLPDYVKLDLKMIYNQNDYLKYVIKGENLLNSEYAYNYDSNKNEPVYAPGINGYAGIEVAF